MTADIPPGDMSVADLRRLRNAALAQDSSHGLGSMMARLAGVPEDWLRRQATEQLGLLLSEELSDLPARVVIGVIRLADSRRRHALPIRLDDGSVAVLVDDPWDLDLQQWLADRIGGWPRVVWGDRAALRTLIDGVNESTGASGDGPNPILDAGNTPSSYDISLETIEQASSPVVRFVDDVLLEAWRAGASDVHLATLRDGLDVKLRVDGVLVSGPVYKREREPAEVLNRVKVLASLDVSETRIPQDGRFRARLAGRELDFRVSIMPSIFGEDAVVRLLDKAQLRGADSRIELPRLGFPDDIRTQIRALAREPHGLFLVTGPTGSGKTTTLYAALSEVHSGEQKIITIEDPVEYELPGVLQIPVNERKGLTFAVGLRSILRHDPDTILVGEIRDRETAEIAVQAALTGHLVFTSVHANSAYDVVSRFMHMGVDLYSFMSSLNGILAQRLLRLNCSDCSAPMTDASVTRLLEEAGFPATGQKLLRATGCENCRYTGYKGRIAVAEVLPVDERMRELVIQRKPMSQLREHARAAGIQPLRHRALALVASGRTTVDEVTRMIAAND